VREFDHFGDCFCTCALIIWTVLLHGALGLLHRSAFEKPSKFIVNLSPLSGGWYRHRSEEYCCYSDILTNSSEVWGLIIPFVVVDVVINVVSPAPGCSAITPARALLIEGGPEVY
jgi:hypothetical protein